MLVQIITKIHKLKKENALLKRSLADTQPPMRPPWSGFREKRADVSSDEESKPEASVGESGSQISTSRGRYASANFDDRPLDGFIDGLERCRIDSRCGSRPSQEQSRRSSVTTSRSSSKSTSAQHHMAGSFLANLHANQMDLIFETDRQRGGANTDSKGSVTAWVDDVLL